MIKSQKTKANVCLYYQHVVPPCVHSSEDEHERLLQYAKAATKDDSMQMDEHGSN